MVNAVTLIPHMLEAFMAGDRGFRRSAAASARSTKAASTPISPAARAE
ncbi:DUF2274 domain-containing protein [Xanthomonas theicola]